MAWLSQNWLWVLFGIAFVGMHLVGHGGHAASHDGHADHAQDAGFEQRADAGSAPPRAASHEATPGMLNTKLTTWALAIFAALSFLLCVLYGLVTPAGLHMHEFLEQVLPAFTWLTWWGFLLGLAESFLYGAYAGLVFCPLYNFLYGRWGPKTIAAK